MLTHPHTPNQFYASNYQIKKFKEFRYLDVLQSYGLV